MSGGCLGDVGGEISKDRFIRQNVISADSALFTMSSSDLVSFTNPLADGSEAGNLSSSDLVSMLAIVEWKKYALPPN